MKKKILVVFGGKSSEYDVSLTSATAVIQAIDTSLYEIFTMGITKNGEWLLYNGPLINIAENKWQIEEYCKKAIISPNMKDLGIWIFEENDKAYLEKIDIVFPVMHGKYGEDGAFQGVLEMSGIPFVGCGCLCSALCMEKDFAHIVAENAGVKCPAYATANINNGDINIIAKEIKQKMQNISFPWFVKPVSEGSSFGISKVNNEKELLPAIKTAFNYCEKIVIEEGISGFEVGCAVKGNKNIVIGELDAISLKQGFFDYHEKYNLDTAKIILPAPLPIEKAEEVKNLAKKLYKLFYCKGLARIDFFVNDCNEIIFNEINTIPGMTSHSRYPGMMAQAGMAFEEMVNLLINDTLEQVINK